MAYTLPNRYQIDKIFIAKTADLGEIRPFLAHALKEKTAEFVKKCFPI